MLPSLFFVAVVLPSHIPCCSFIGMNIQTMMYLSSTQRKVVAINGDNMIFEVVESRGILFDPEVVTFLCIIDILCLNEYNQLLFDFLGNHRLHII